MTDVATSSWQQTKALEKLRATNRELADEIKDILKDLGAIELVNAYSREDRAVRRLFAVGRVLREVGKK